MTSTPIQVTPIHDFSLWLQPFTQATVLVELAVLATCVLLAWGGVVVLGRALGLADRGGSVWLGNKGVDGVLFPALLLVLAYVAKAVASQFMAVPVLVLAMPVLVSLLTIRVGVRVLHLAFGDRRWVRVTERSISWLAWLAVVLWTLGLLPVILSEMDQVSWSLGGAQLTLRTLIEGVLTAGAVLIITLWISSAIENQLLRNASGGELSLRKAVSNALKALLTFVGLMMALSAVGIDLTALSVLGGAIGVGIGFGLQKLAANYVSGFVILAERSVRIGDMVMVDGFEGRVTNINARYTLIRSLGGRESIVPNEILMTTRVENLSLADRRVWVSTVVSVSYDSDVAQVQALLLEATASHARVLKDPGPSASLSAFGADGLEFTVGFWIADPENGQMGIRSMVNMSILASLRANGIEIPFPQRVVHTVAGPTPESRIQLPESPTDAGVR
ncbi:MAG: mechanosensitive ion channel [Burkholderiaceae bacterium]|nr:mechanosensitive ion channel [Burkholderiaceae bacterium]